MMWGQPVSKASQEITGTSKVFARGEHGDRPCCHVHGVHAPTLPAPTFTKTIATTENGIIPLVVVFCFVLLCFCRATQGPNFLFLSSFS